MAIVQATPQAEIEAYIHRQAERMRRALIRLLQYCGEACVAEARTRGSYTDRTGNLRSSVGYAVVVDGKVVEQSSPSGTAQGGAAAQSFINELAATIPQGTALIVVAGMEYAAYVAATRDVLDSAEELAKRLVPQMLSQLQQ